MNTIDLTKEGVSPPVACAIRILDSLSHPLIPRLFSQLDRSPGTSTEELLSQLKCSHEVLSPILNDLTKAGIIQTVDPVLAHRWEFFPNRLQMLMRRINAL